MLFSATVIVALNACPGFRQVRSKASILNLWMACPVAPSLDSMKSSLDNVPIIAIWVALVRCKASSNNLRHPQQRCPNALHTLDKPLQFFRHDGLIAVAHCLIWLVMNVDQQAIGSGSNGGVGHRDDQFAPSLLQEPMACWSTFITSQ